MQIWNTRTCEPTASEIATASAGEFAEKYAVRVMSYEFHLTNQFSSMQAFGAHNTASCCPEIDQD